MKTVHNKINKEDLLKDILEKYNNRGDNKFKLTYYLSVGKYSKAPIQRCGGWNTLLRELNIPINMNKKVSKEDAIKDLIKFKKEYNSLSSSLYRKHGSYSQIVIDNLFGSFTEFVKEAGFISDRNVRYISDEELLEKLMELYNEHGYINSSLIMNEATFTYQTVLNRFGSMSKVYELLNIDNDVNKNSYFSSVDKVVSIISDILEEKPIKEWTCKELMNPEKNNHLYVDAYYPKHNLVIEYDGKQHYEYVPFLHKSYEKFERTQLLDKHKEKILNKLGINLIRIRYDDPKTYEFLKVKVTKSLLNMISLG